MSHVPTLQQSVTALLVRDLDGFRRTLAAFPSDAAVWTVVPALPNGAGTLALHVAGNLRHFIGATLGGTGYVRDRAREFAARDVPRAELVATLDAAAAEVRATLAALPDARLAEFYPLPLGEHRYVTGDFLQHLATHAAYHLGQADAHRRVVTGDPAAAGLGAVAVIASAVPA
ncbi:MAG: DinB family protein [Gemmatimonadales bacterium]|nr:DinB family protein [Gemmatimonadales bacterium]